MATVAVKFMRPNSDTLQVRSGFAALSHEYKITDADSLNDAYAALLAVAPSTVGNLIACNYSINYAAGSDGKTWIARVDYESPSASIFGVAISYDAGMTSVPFRKDTSNVEINPTVHVPLDTLTFSVERTECDAGWYDDGELVAWQVGGKTKSWGDLNATTSQYAAVVACVNRVNASSFLGGASKTWKMTMPRVRLLDQTDSSGRVLWRVNYTFARCPYAGPGGTSPEWKIEDSEGNWREVYATASFAQLELYWPKRIVTPRVLL